MSKNEIGELISTIASLVLVVAAAVITGVLWTVATKLGVNPFNDDTEDTWMDSLVDRAAEQLEEGPEV